MSIEIIELFLPLVLAINTSIIIPKLVNNIYLLFVSCKYYNCNSMYNFNFGDIKFKHLLLYSNQFIYYEYRCLVILFLRTISSIIIPLIASLFLLQNCGNYWSIFWNDCNSERSKFDITQHLDTLGSVTLLSASDVCDAQTMNSIGWNKCLRTFCSQWSYVMIKKLCIMTFMPFVIVILKNFRIKVRYWLKNILFNIKDKTKVQIKSISRLCFFQTYNSQNALKSHLESQFELKHNSLKNMQIDIEYGMILTKCESMIIWFTISPLVIPLTIMSIYTNYFVYHRMINKYNWKIIPFNNNNNNDNTMSKTTVIPIYALWISIILSQVFAVTVFFLCITVDHECDNIGFAFVALLILVDITCLGVKRYLRHQH